MKKLKSKELKFSGSERKKIKDIIRASLRTDISTQTVMKGPIKFIKQNAFNLTVDNPKARKKLIRTLKKAAGPMQLVVRFKGPVVIGVKRMTRSKKVLNPITGKYILISGKKCKNMLKEGFVIRDGILRPPKDYMRKNKRNATLILLTREISKIKDKMKNAPPDIKTKLKNIVEKLENVRVDTNTGSAPIPLPPRVNAPNLGNGPAPIQLPSNAKAPNLRNSSMNAPIQLPSNTKAPNLRNGPRDAPMQLPSNTKPAWRRAVNFVNPIRMFKKPPPSNVNKPRKAENTTIANKSRKAENTTITNKSRKAENTTITNKSRDINKRMESVMDNLKK